MIATADMFTASNTSGLTAALAGPSGRPSAPARTRQRVTTAQLVELVNQQLASRADCEGLEVDAGTLALRFPDAEGCNWTPGGLRLRVAHGPSTRALAGVRQVMEWARQTLELADGDTDSMAA